MSCREGETCLTRKASPTEQELELVSLKDVPLEVRRKEAKEPLFLKRYE
jgi:hypothetical protein